jgi:hypothetical protein
MRPFLQRFGELVTRSPEGPTNSHIIGTVDVNAACDSAAFGETMDHTAVGKNHVDQMFISEISMQAVQAVQAERRL